jgi:hypothetical protein
MAELSGSMEEEFIMPTRKMSENSLLLKNFVFEIVE